MTLYAPSSLITAMWFVDVHHDHGWLGSTRGQLPEPKARIPFLFDSAPDLRAEALVYGDNFEIRHARVLVNTDSLEATQRFIGAHLAHITRRIEVIASVVAGRLVPVRHNRWSAHDPGPW